MPNITLAMDEKLLTAARALAKAEGTTLNAMVRRLVSESVAQDRRREEARLRLIELMDNSTARLPKNYKFDREKLYESPSLSRHKRARVRGNRKSGLS